MIRGPNDTMADEGVIRLPEDMLKEGGCKFQTEVYKNGAEWNPRVQPFGVVNCVLCRCKVLFSYGDLVGCLDNISTNFQIFSSARMENQPARDKSVRSWLVRWYGKTPRNAVLAAQVGYPENNFADWHVDMLCWLTDPVRSVTIIRFLPDRFKWSQSSPQQEVRERTESRPKKTPRMKRALEVPFNFSFSFEGKMPNCRFWRMESLVYLTPTPRGRGTSADENP